MMSNSLQNPLSSDSTNPPRPSAAGMAHMCCHHLEANAAQCSYCHEAPAPRTWLFPWHWKENTHHLNLPYYQPGQGLSIIMDWKALLIIVTSMFACLCLYIAYIIIYGLKATTITALSTTAHSLMNVTRATSSSLVNLTMTMAESATGFLAMSAPFWLRAPSNITEPLSEPLDVTAFTQVLHKTAEDTETFLNALRKLCRPETLPRFAQETRDISAHAFRIGQEPHLPNRKNVTLELHHTVRVFTEVHKTLLDVSYGGERFVDDYIDWLLFLQNSFQSLPAQSNRNYATEWSSFVDTIESEFVKKNREATSYLSLVQDTALPLLERAQDVAEDTSTSLTDCRRTIRSRMWDSIPPLLYDVCWYVSGSLRTQDRYSGLLRAASLSLASAHDTLLVLHMSLNEMVSHGQAFKRKLADAKGRANQAHSADLMFKQFVSVVADVQAKEREMKKMLKTYYEEDSISL